MTPASVDKLSLFRQLMDKVVLKSFYNKPFSSFKQRELKSLSKEISDSFNSGEKVSYGALRDYKYMYQGKRNYPLTISDAKLSILCAFVKFDKKLFSSHQFKASHKRVKLIILKNFLEGSIYEKGGIASIIRRRYKILAEAGKISEMDINFREVGAPDIDKEAWQIAKEENADIIIWGEFYHPGKIRMNLLLLDHQQYQITRAAEDLNRSRQLLTDLSELSTGEALYEPEFLLFFAAAIKAYQNKEDEKAINYWNYLQALNETIADTYFYRAVLQHDIGDLMGAEKDYLKALGGQALGHNIRQKAAINLAILYIWQGSDSKLNEAVEFLENVNTESNQYSKQIYAHLFQIHLLRKDITSAESILEKWDNEDFMRYQKKYKSAMQDLIQDSKEKEKFIIISGNKLIKIDGEDYALDSTILSINNHLQSKMGQVELIVLSLLTKTVYKLTVSESKVKVKDTLEVLPELQILRGYLFEQNANKCNWIILNPTRIPLKASDDLEHEYFMRFLCCGHQVKKRLEVEDKHLLISEDSFRTEFGENPIADCDRLENIQLVAYDKFNDNQDVLYSIPGLTFMEYGYLKSMVLRFQSHFQGLLSVDLKHKTAQFIYQKFGVIPESYL